MVRNIRFSLLGLLSFAIYQKCFAIECPDKIRVQASTFTSIQSTETKKIDEFYELGEKQTSTAYITSVLKVANNLNPVDEVLTKKTNQNSSSTCQYKGATTTLSIFPIQNEWANKGYTADLRLGKIDYDAAEGNGGNPSSHHGLALDIYTHLTRFGKGKLSVAKRRVSRISFDLNIQVPIDDSGTESFEETAEVGRADDVKYTIVE